MRFRIPGAARLAISVGISFWLPGNVPSARAAENAWVWEAVNAPTGLTAPREREPVLVAIVDDGFLLSHETIAGFIWQNPLEIPGNGVDDDGNGYADDSSGWDVSDGDNDVSPPVERLEHYAHGTHIAGLVAQVARRAWGDAAPSALRILPVKAMSDMAERPYLREGFDGIRYALDAGADIIVTAWGVNQISHEQTGILRDAADRGVLIVASAGNAPQELEQYPAAYRPVLAVAALDPQGRKAEFTGYGQFVDIAAPGTGIVSADVVSDTAYKTLEGTSYTTAIVGAAAALVRAGHPAMTALQVDACLKSSADALDRVPLELAGKLGAGRLNIAAAVDCALLRQAPRATQRLAAPKGFLHLQTESDQPTEWVIEPAGEFKGIRLWPSVAGADAGRGTLQFRAAGAGEGRTVGEYALENLPESVFVPGSSVAVTLNPAAGGPAGGSLLEYEVETIDFSKRYCSGTERVQAEGIIEDGSGPNDYAPASDCKWLITAPPGQVIHFRFVEFDTESKTDFIYFFNGAGTHEDIMARFSGPNLPPEFTSWSNQALMWFVTNREVQGKGWKAEITFRTPPQ